MPAQIERLGAEDEGDRRCEVAAEQLSSTAVKEYPVLTEDDLEKLLEPNQEAPQPSSDEEEPAPEPPPAAEVTLKGARAIYGHELPRGIGGVALEAGPQSRGFRPAGLHGIPGARTVGPRRRTSRSPRINGVFETK